MPASLAVRAHWSVSQPVARKAAISFTPGVHSLPEKVLNDQQTNMPHLRLFSSAARFCMSAVSAAERVLAERTAIQAASINKRLTVGNSRENLRLKEMIKHDTNPAQFTYCWTTSIAIRAHSHSRWGCP